MAAIVSIAAPARRSRSNRSAGSTLFIPQSLTLEITPVGLSWARPGRAVPDRPQLPGRGPVPFATLQGEFRNRQPESQVPKGDDGWETLGPDGSTGLTGRTSAFWPVIDAWNASSVSSGP
jgi:hypothetical protein